jgi:hypothetical protein
MISDYSAHRFKLIDKIRVISMKSLSVPAVALAVGVLGFANGAYAQATNLAFEGDMVRGAQQGAPGPFCVLNNQFKHLEKVVFRFRVLKDGKPLDASGLKSLVVELPDGQKLNAQYGPHPGGNNPATDYFWTAIWIIPDNYPNGTFAYKAVATDQQGQSQTWEPFKRTTSQLQVVAGAIEIRRQ